MNNLVTMTEDEIYAKCIESGDIIIPLKLLCHALAGFCQELEKSSILVLESMNNKALSKAVDSLAESAGDMAIMIECTAKVVKALNRASESLHEADNITK
jgi:hypothetical protein